MSYCRRGVSEVVEGEGWEGRVDINSSMPECMGPRVEGRKASFRLKVRRGVRGWNVQAGPACRLHECQAGVGRRV